MKTILITILIVILLLFGYNKYVDYKRHHPQTTDYIASRAIDTDPYNKKLLYNYYEAIETLNNHVTLSWSANGIDVQTPKKDNAESKDAVSLYGALLAKTKFYETQLIQSKEAKAKGLTNADLKMLAEKGKTSEQLKKKVQEIKRVKRIYSLFKEVGANLQLNNTGPMVYELQKLLIAKGYGIPLDGVFKTATLEALQAFEVSKDLYSDGRLDMLTLSYLLE